MPTAYRKQHYLPAVYLKQFSFDGPKATRKSLIHRTTKDCISHVTVESQCVRNFTYSKSEPERVEKFFQDTENHYRRITKLVWAKQRPAELDYFALILVMFDFHIRNIAYENLTGEENYYAYLRRLSYVRSGILGSKSDFPASEEESKTHLRNYWRIKLLQTPAGGELVTSDNPCIWCNWEDGNQLHCMIMPILPNVCAIAFDNRYSRINYNLTEADTAQLNAWQVLHCRENLYSLSRPSSVQETAIKAYLAKRKTKHGYTDADSWEMRYVSLKGAFEFISRL